MAHTLGSLVVVLLFAGPAAAAEVRTSLLIVGGTESGWAAAIQAARMGVPSITIVHDGEWLGGQYTEQGLACVDENKGVGKVGWGVPWNPMKRSFHRFGLFKELMDRIEAFNEAKYGSKMPGLPFHGPSTFRPAEAEAVFREMLKPYLESGQVRLITNTIPTAAITSDDGKRLIGMRFRSLADRSELTVHASITIDASDWGEVVQLSGAAFEVGADPKARYGEPNAPEQADPAEMNPITWTMILEQADDASAIPRPAHYDASRYLRATPFGKSEAAALKWDHPVKGAGIAPWPEKGKPAARQLSIATMRRIVEGSTSKDGKTSMLLCYSNGQDYPLERLPRHVAEALERTEPGAAKKNIALMTREQRQIIFDDAKSHSLGLLHHLQTFVHDHARDTTHSVKNFRLSTEFGTADRLPPKPYIRESLRLKALYMMREQDGRNFDGADKKAAREAFAGVLYPDGLFSWQFHYDFHDTGRAYVKGREGGSAWTSYEKPGRGTGTVSDRSLFPLRSLIPATMDGLIGAQGNVGVSSIVSAAIRLHDQRIHIGQAAGAVAAYCLEKRIAPREIPLNRARVEDLRAALCGGTKGVPMLLWPYRDLPADHAAFVAINRLAARGLLPVSRREVDFEPDAPAAAEWQAAVLKLGAEAGLTIPASTPGPKQTRGEFARWLWSSIKDQPPQSWPVKKPGDADADGIPDGEDALPFLASNRSWPKE